VRASTSLGLRDSIGYVKLNAIVAIGRGDSDALIADKPTDVFVMGAV